MQLNGVGFGAPLNAIRTFGRPTRVLKINKEHFEFCYAPSGFALEIERGVLVYFAFFIGVDEFQPCVDDLTFCQPIVSSDLKEFRFTNLITQESVVSWLGEPLERDADEDETVLFYGRKQVVLEFEFSTENKLKRWSLYPEKKVVE